MEASQELINSWYSCSLVESAEGVHGGVGSHLDYLTPEVGRRSVVKEKEKNPPKGSGRGTTLSN